MNIETSKYLGGVGALLIVIGFLGIFGTGWAGLLDLVGLILVLTAMKGLADTYKEQGIFNNALYGIIAAIIGVVAFVAAVVATVLTAIATGFNLSDPSTWAQQFTDFSALWGVFGTAITGIFISLIVLFVFFIIAFMLIRKSLNLLASKSGVGMFATAGLLMLIGAVLTIIIIGLILIWIGFILLTVAFFSIKAQATMPASTTPQQPPT